MADQSDVEKALVSVITAALYPAGVAGPAAASPVNGVVTNISRGWPTGTTLDAVIASAGVLVRVYPEPGMTRNTTRHMIQWRQVVPPAVATLAATVSGAAVTFAGIGSPAHAVAVVFGSIAARATAAYRLSPGDGPVEVAAALAAQVPGATAVAGVLTLPTNLPVDVRIGVDQMMAAEIRRQDQGFRISTWAGNDTARDATTIAIDQALVALAASDPAGNPVEAGSMFLALADGSFGWMRYRSTTNLDQAEKAGLYRRDLCYLVEYGTDLSEIAAPILVIDEQLSASGAQVIQRGSLIASTSTIII